MSELKKRMSWIRHWDGGCCDHAFPAALATPMRPGSENGPPPQYTPWSGDRHLALLLRELETAEGLIGLLALSSDQEAAHRNFALAESLHQNVADRASAFTMSAELRKEIGARLDRLRAELDRLKPSFEDPQTAAPSS